MAVNNFNNRLILYTESNLNEDIVESVKSECISVLQKNNFMGDKFNYQNKQLFYAGSKLSSLLMFCGCAPKIQLSLQNNGLPDSNFVALQLTFFSKNKYFYPGKQPFYYCCPKCSTSIELSIGKEKLLLDKNSYFSCSQCAKHYHFNAINWRRKAGYGQFFIEVRGVFESEAIPSDQLLKILHGVTKSKWAYFYADESS